MKGWGVGGGCGKGSRIRAQSGLWNHPEGTGAGAGLLAWALGVGIRQAPASCLSKFTSVSVAFWPPRVRSLQGTSNQPKELCILLVCVHMGLPCCSKDSPSGKAERTCSLQKHLSSVLQQGIQTQPRLTFPQSPDESQAGLLLSPCRPLPCRPCLFALVPIRTQIWWNCVCVWWWGVKRNEGSKPSQFLSPNVTQGTSTHISLAKTSHVSLTLIATKAGERAGVY